MNGRNFHKINFAPNQKLPPGYIVGWSDNTEMYQWYTYDEESVIFCDRWMAWRSAWAHYNAKR
jgi:hypothetical protein